MSETRETTEPSGPSTPRTAANGAPLRRTSKTVLYGLGFYAATQLAGAFLAKNAVAADAVQAALAEWGAGRIGIAWSDPTEPPPVWTALATRAARGAAMGIAVAATVVVFALATRAASLAPNTPLVGQLVVGLLASVLGAVRDELLLRGVVLHALDGWASSPWRVVACAGAAAAASWGTGHANVVELAIAAASGATLAAVWLHDRGAWMAVGANTAWTWASGTLLRGGLLDVRARSGAWGGGDVGLQGSLAVALVLTVVAVAACAWTARDRRAPSAS